MLDAACKGTVTSNAGPRARPVQALDTVLGVSVDLFSVDGVTGALE
jgi:hypothetical protein